MYAVRLEPDGVTIPVGTVFCLGRNYAAHAREMGNEIPVEPVIFIKPATAVRDGKAPITLPDFSRNIHYEIELVLLVDDVPKLISHDEATRFVLGYGVGVDLTARDVQEIAKKKGLPWTLAKGFDGSAPVSHFVRFENGIPPTARLRLTINHEIKQEDTIANMIYSVPSIIVHLSRYFTLRRGDLIFTGTPEGVGELRTGDTLTAELVDIVSFTTHIQKS